MLRDLQHVQNLIRKNKAYRFLKNITGNPPYWQKMFYETLAMIGTLGVPTWFLTFSAAGMKWPEVIQANAYIMVMVDQFSKWMEIQPLA